MHCVGVAGCVLCWLNVVTTFEQLHPPHTRDTLPFNDLENHHFRRWSLNTWVLFYTILSHDIDFSVFYQILSTSIRFYHLVRIPSVLLLPLPLWSPLHRYGKSADAEQQASILNPTHEDAATAVRPTLPSVRPGGVSPTLPLPSRFRHFTNI